jgi:adenine-specific DNA-methyltransferase
MSTYPQVPQLISDPISENLTKLRELFPSAVKDGALDMDALRAELGDFEEIRPGDESYELGWVGKQAAKKETFKPLLGKTLALKDDGKYADTTQNLFVEGDNLEALKLLRQNYFGEVKMMYIDPPYNTGKDFVYSDKFATKAAESEQEEGALSVEGKRLIKNEKTSNRFHARWLDMMYPRLRLAKDLLSEDGVIFISIDDGEISNLRALCDNVFGEDKFAAQIIWKKRNTPPNDRVIGAQHDYILVYVKSSLSGIRLRPRNDQQIARYKNPDNHPKGPWAAGDLTGNVKGGRYSQALYFPVINPNTGKEFYPANNGNWRFNSEKIQKLIANDEIYFGQDGTSSPKLKRFLADVKEGATWTTLWDFAPFNTEGSNEMQDILGNSVLFESPKPSGLIKLLCQAGSGPDDLVLDFFSGSATTAHAVMQLNADDGGKRRFIMVQLPEICADDTEAAKAGYKTIAEIGKERIRRAGEKIREELKGKQAEWKKQQAIETKKGGKLSLDEDVEAADETNPYVLDPESLDIGFKSFRIEDTKINWLKKDLRGEQLEFDDTTTQDALDFVPGFTDTDVVYELMLRQSNIPLTGTITRPTGTGKRTYLYADSYLVCLEEKVARELVEALAAVEPTPNKYFFRDSAFGKDIALKDETFRRLKAEIHKHHGDLGTAYTVEFI